MTTAAGVQDPAEPLRQARRVGGLRAWLNAADLAVYREVRSLARRPDDIRRVRAFSTLGEYGALWFGMGALGALVDPPRSRRWLRGAGAVAIGHALSSTIKVAVNRRRPAVEDLEHLMATPTGLSFPSTHTACAFAAASAYGPLMPGAPLYLLAAAMGASRLFLGVHYPSDVAAGAAVGTLVGVMAR